MAGPGTGKTWSAIQLAHTLATKCSQEQAVPILPVVVFVQRLVREDSLLRYLQRQPVPNVPPNTWSDVVQQAFSMRAVVLVLDGIDEAASQKDEISRFLRVELLSFGMQVCVIWYVYDTLPQKIFFNAN